MSIKGTGRLTWLLVVVDCCRVQIVLGLSHYHIVRIYIGTFQLTDTYITFTCIQSVVGRYILHDRSLHDHCVYMYLRCRLGMLISYGIRKIQSPLSSSLHIIHVHKWYRYWFIHTWFQLWFVYIICTNCTPPQKSNTIYWSVITNIISC